MPSRRSGRTAPPSRDELIAIGVIRKAHGVHGEASTESLTDSLERFEEVNEAYLVSPDDQQILPITIESSRVHVGRALVQFKEISSPEQLREYYNWTIEIPESDRRELADDEYFLHDLIGLEMVAPDGAAIGRVIEVAESGGGLLLTVKPEGTKAFEVPFAAGICTEVDIAGRRIVADLPKGLANLDDVDDEEAKKKKQQKKRRDETGRS